MHNFYVRGQGRGSSESPFFNGLLNAKSVPGRPDLYFPAMRRAVLVHGCFWHRHRGCKLARLPKSRLEFWVPKLTENAARDRRVLRSLRQLGISALVVWECETRNKEKLTRRLASFLG